MRVKVDNFKGKSEKSADFFKNIDARAYAMKEKGAT